MCLIRFSYTAWPLWLTRGERIPTMSLMDLPLASLCFLKFSDHITTMYNCVAREGVDIADRGTFFSLRAFSPFSRFWWLLNTWRHPHPLNSRSFSINKITSENSVSPVVHPPAKSHQNRPLKTAISDQKERFWNQSGELHSKNEVSEVRMRNSRMRTRFPISKYEIHRRKRSLGSQNGQFFNKNEASAGNVENFWVEISSLGRKVPTTPQNVEMKEKLTYFYCFTSKMSRK